MTTSPSPMLAADAHHNESAVKVLRVDDAIHIQIPPNLDAYMLFRAQVIIQALCAIAIGVIAGAVVSGLSTRHRFSAFLQRSAAPASPRA